MRGCDGNAQAALPSLQASSEAEVDVRIGRALHAAAWETRGTSQLAAPLLEAVGDGVLERFFVGEDARDFEAANLDELNELAR